MSLYVPSLVSPGLAGPGRLAGPRRGKKILERERGQKIRRFTRPRDIIAPPFTDRRGPAPRELRGKRLGIYGRRIYAQSLGGHYLVPFVPTWGTPDTQVAGLFKSLKKIVKKVVSVPTKIVKKTVQTVAKNWKTIAIAGAAGAALYFGGPVALQAIKKLGVKKLAAAGGKAVLKQVVKRVTGTQPPAGAQAVPIASMADGSTLYEWDQVSTVQVPQQESSSWWQQARAVAVDAGKAYIAAKAAPALPGSIEATQADYATGMIQYGGDQPAGYGATAPYSTAAPDPYASAAAEAGAEGGSPILAGFGGAVLPVLIVGGLLLMSGRKGGRA